jgi:hypothetical protein
MTPILGRREYIQLTHYNLLNKVRRYHQRPKMPTVVLGFVIFQMKQNVQVNVLKEPSSKCSGKATKGKKAIVVKLEHNCEGK